MAIIVSRATTNATSVTGNITTSTSSATVLGSSTLFTTQTAVGKALFSSTDVYIGTILTINSDTSLTLTANAAAAVSGVSYKVGYLPKNSPLTNSEIDTNFINLNDNKVEVTDAVSTNIVNAVVRRDSSGNFSASTVTVSQLVETSSIALKENISPITGALDSVLSLNGVTYDRKDNTTKNEAGLIAEQVYDILPNIVSLNESGKPEGINYTKLSAYLIEAVKELKNELDMLKGSR